jgi:hypothetical protein
MTRSTAKWFLALFTLLFLVACSSASRVSKIEPASKELPKELLSKFEVLEASSTPAPTPSEKPEKRKKKTRKSKKKEPEVFTIPDRRGKIDPVWVGEKQVLEVTYIGLAAGDFTMEALPIKKIADRNVYHLKGTVKSSAVLNLFYRLDDMIESFWDFEGLFSHRFHMSLDETKQTRDVLELYDSEKKKAFYWNRRNQPDKPPVESKEYFDMPQFVQDSFTAIYYVRTLPLEMGKVYTFPVVSEGKGWDCVLTVIRHEMMDTPLGKRNTIVVRPQTRYNGVMKQEHGDSFIWLTDDDRRFVVRLEAKVKIGSVAAQLKEVVLGEQPPARTAP